MAGLGAKYRGRAIALAIFAGGAAIQFTTQESAAQTTPVAPPTPDDVIAVPLQGDLSAFSFDPYSFYNTSHAKIGTQYYGLTQNSTGDLNFVSVNPTSGALQTISTVPITELSLGPIPLLFNKDSAIIFRTDAIIYVNKTTHAVTLGPAPPSTFGALAVDPQSAITLGFSSNAIESIDPASGVVHSISTHDLNGFSLPAASTVDPQTHTFFLNGVNNVYAINEATGSLKTLQTNKSLFSLAFDVYSNTLYGVTTCCPNNLVKINTTNGGTSVLASVGDSRYFFAGANPFSLSPDDRAFILYGPTPTLVSADVAANRSWYVTSNLDKNDKSFSAWMYLAGYNAGNKGYDIPTSTDSTAILDFGNPAVSGSIYGATGYRMAPNMLSTSAIKAGILSYAAGYFDGTGPAYGAHINLVVGLSNQFSTKTFNSDSILKAHGLAWGKMIDSIQSALKASPYGALVSIAGGMDIEVDYSPPTIVKTWLSGYGARPLSNFGELAGKKYTWTNDDLLSVMTGPIYPEIYSVYGSQAAQWQKLSLYAYTKKGKPLNIAAPLSQRAACVQKNACTSTPLDYGTDNTPLQAWTLLHNKLNSDARTSQTLLPSTDIKWRNL